MPSFKTVARRISEHAFGSTFDRALENSCSETYPRFLFCWNRGLGDIALGLMPLFDLIRHTAPSARISVITREDLKSAFALAGVEEVHTLHSLQRGQRINVANACATLAISRKDFVAVFSDPDPDRWLDERRAQFPPALLRNPIWDRYADRFLESFPGQIVIAAHLHSETAQHHGYMKDWLAPAWTELFSRFRTNDLVQWVLLGDVAEPRFEGGNVTDLRGRTSLLELLSLIKNHCRILIAPDSGVLTMTYYLAVPFSIEVISTWSNPRQGILKQGCASPNPLLRHVPLFGAEEDVRNVPVADVAAAVECALARTLQPGT